jgi:SAM-dependent methyltransferase
MKLLAAGGAGDARPVLNPRPLPWLTADRWLIPPRLAPFRRLRARPFDLLDVGCGNHSPAFAKPWYPRCRYTGVDRDRYNNDAGDFALMDRFVQLDLEASDLHELPDGEFDVVVCAHVLEHLRDGLAVLRRLCRKLRAGGGMYLEFPSVRSLALPSARGSLHFCDDPTHVRVYAVAEVCNLLLAESLVIRRAGRRRSWARVALTPALAAGSFLRHGWVNGGCLWDGAGFADSVRAVKPEETGRLGL